ncbi:MAG: NAD(P)/FAD-dependent oxidoreductase [Candidatus Heimdallarchaeota archaeon]
MTSSTNPKVVIIGGGTGGVIAANILGRKVGKKASITLISERENILYEPDNLFRIFDKKGISKQFKSLFKVVNKKRVQIEIDTVVKVDPESQKILTKEGKMYSYDYLVIASGARYVYDRVPGYEEAAYHYHTPGAALKLRDALQEFEGGDIITGVSDLPFKCPVATMEFTLMAHHFFKRKKMLDKVRIHYLSPLASAFSIEKVSDKIEQAFEKNEIELHTFFNTDTIDPEKQIVYSLEGEEMRYDLLVMVPPHMGQDYVIASGLGDDDGWLPVDRYTLEHEKYNNIYGCGDATDLPVSKSGSAAHHTSKIIAKRIIRRIKGKKAKKKYKGQVQCFLMTSLTSSMFLAFSYTRQPRRIGLWRVFGRPLYLFKKIFPFFFFNSRFGVLSGRV